MQGNPRVIEALNQALADELAAIIQYTVHAEMCANWGYSRLEEVAKKRARDEMRHAEELIERILFLEGTPLVERIGELRIGRDVPGQIEADLAAEARAVGDYNRWARIAMEEGDRGSEELFERILETEEGHLSDLEALREQMHQMGLANFLASRA